jgi:hypothetical protein
VDRYDCACERHWTGPDCNIPRFQCDAGVMELSTQTGLVGCNCSGTSFEGPRCSQSLNLCVDAIACPSLGTQCMVEHNGANSCASHDTFVSSCAPLAVPLTLMHTIATVCSFRFCSIHLVWRPRKTSQS